ncbi:E3 ubiquitin-protein ligase mbr2 [Phtheirospermum japonicum]|uniref:RING-type E3 ubiquitin transferase n=1 Tax=Phtheirospermum japonicum TaxID=374723 RepID=A0A830CK88_9LAMI|nr:E3 ubiquitin-protein ligase mbr2 [Phtheirospermum japonicum]GFQ01077.1 E3 ubiquitin-protein ligase mbr2 [Phtheirospermum japonicum]GFQ01078.1 E3 ubiquitin-protein ligase mbr2 [Phtheirospermum japonicum]
MAIFHSPAAVNNAYYDNMFTLYSHNPTAPAINMGYQNAAIFGYVHAGYALMYSQYWVPLYYLQYQPQPCHDDSWILNAQEQDHVAQSNYYHQFMPCDDESLILNAQQEEEDDDDEIELNADELREWDLLDGELVFYDASDDDNGLSEETITKHLKIRDCHQHQHIVDNAQICVVCQDCLFDENEKIATLNCGHDFHAGCIKSWLMLKNCCPLCKGMGINP